MYLELLTVVGCGSHDDVSQNYGLLGYDVV